MLLQQLRCTLSEAFTAVLLCVEEYECSGFRDSITGSQREVFSSAYNLPAPLLPFLIYSFIQPITHELSHYPLPFPLHDWSDLVCFTSDPCHMYDLTFNNPDTFKSAVNSREKKQLYTEEAPS